MKKNEKKRFSKPPRIFEKWTKINVQKAKKAGWPKSEKTRKFDL